MSTPPAKPPEILDKIVDLVLAHKPKTNKVVTKRKKPSSKTNPKKKSEH